MALGLNDARLRAEMDRCLSCEERPCRTGCPAGLTPFEFILPAREGTREGLRRAAAHVMAHNPLGGACGEACPESLCMAHCARAPASATLGPVAIPALQAAIVRRARERGLLPRFAPQPATGHRVAVVGAGPAGLGAASVLAKAGHAVAVFDGAPTAGGTARLIPPRRLDPSLLDGDLEWLLGLGAIALRLGSAVPLPRDLLSQGFAAVIVAAGRPVPIPLEVPGGGLAIPWTRLLGSRPPSLRARRVAVVGGGRVALDCAAAALARGAARVELLALEEPGELRLDRSERAWLAGSGVAYSGRVRVAAVRGSGRGPAPRITGLRLQPVELPPEAAFHPSRVVERRGGARERRDLDAVVVAIGGTPALRREPHPRILYAGEIETGPSTVVEALASGKRAALEVHQLLSGRDAACPDRASCADGAGCPKRATCPEWAPPAPG